jgi:transposase-like protein
MSGKLSCIYFENDVTGYSRIVGNLKMRLLYEYLLVVVKQLIGLAIAMFAVYRSYALEIGRNEGVGTLLRR